MWPCWLGFLFALSASQTLTENANSGEQVSAGLWIFVDLCVLGTAAWLIRLYVKRWKLKRAARQATA